MSKIGEVKGKIPSVISREEIEKHYITGWQLAKVLASVCVAIAATYWLLTPVLIDSKVSKFNEKLDQIITLLQQKKPH